MENNPIAFVSENAFENLPRMESLGFDMYCGGCDNIPFWRWLKLNQTFSTSVTCSDCDGEKLSNLQANNVTACVDGACGQECRQDCSNNCYNNTCHVVSGLCLSGCRKGWKRPYCKQHKLLMPYCKEFTSKPADNYTKVLIVVGAFLVTTLVAVIVLATLRYRKKKRQHQRQTVREFDSVTYIGVRSTETHYDDTIPVVQDQPDDQCVDSSTVELEQSKAEYDHTEVVDSSAEELELSNTEYITDVVNSSAQELELFNA